MPTFNDPDTSIRVGRMYWDSTTRAWRACISRKKGVQWGPVLKVGSYDNPSQGTGAVYQKMGCAECDGTGFTLTGVRICKTCKGSGRKPVLIRLRETFVGYMSRSV